MEEKQKIRVRTCIACRSKKDKKELLHICYNNGNVLINPDSSAGRGAYLCYNIMCMEKAFKKNIFHSAFKNKVDEDIKIRLENELFMLLESFEVEENSNKQSK